VRLLAAGASVSYHARYAISSTQTKAQKATVTLELWRRPPDVRQETVVKTASATTETAAFQGASGTVECSRQGMGPFACRQTSTGGVASPQDLAATAAKELVGATVTQHSETVAGRSATCFELVLSGATTEVCVDAQGIPVRISSGGSTMTMQAYDRTVPSGIFTPPAAAS
jgi:hypothetical protein